MRPAYILIAALLLLPSLATASKQQGEEFLALDLTALPNGAIYFLKCSNYEMKGPAECGFTSVWQQSNSVRGLQSSILTNGKAWEPDTRLLS